MDFNFYVSIIIRLVVACILGGIIGYERENMHRPAGFRTHILVCVGAALVMVTSEFIFEQYKGLTNMDPARLGAQVISGIGFLGAGTIIREGFNVKGLTTAASLWAVSCVGISAGIGFYEGAITATVLIYITLIILRKMEHVISKKNKNRIIHIQSIDKKGQIGSITAAFDDYKFPIRKIDFINSESERELFVKILFRDDKDSDIGKLIEDLHNIEGIHKVFEE